jgi:hypothetical protein
VKNLLSIIGKNNEGKSIADVMGHTKPSSFSFLGRGKGGLGVLEVDLLPKAEMEEGRDVGGVAMSFLIRGAPVEMLIGTYVMDISNKFTTMEPGLGIGTSAIHNHLGMVLHEFYATEFCGVLLRVMRLSVLIADHVLAVEGKDMFIILLASIVAAQGRGGTFMTNKVIVCEVHLTFAAHPIDIDHEGHEAKIDLSASIPPIRRMVGKIAIGSNSLVKTDSVQGWEARFHVPDQRKTENGFGQLRGILQGFGNDAFGAPQKVLFVLVFDEITTGTG